MFKRTKLRLVCIAFLCMVMCQVLAQVDGDTITGKVHQIDKVTVIAGRLPNKLSSTVPIQSLSQEFIRQSGIQNMADAVRRFAGANVRDYGGIGGLKTVSIRNMGAAHTAVSYDGVAVSNCQAGQIDLGRFSLDNVSVLSLAIGQTEDLLQSARHYASVGVLSIETEKPYFSNNRNSSFRMQLRGGAFGYIAPSLRWWKKLSNRTRFSVDGSYMRADGNYPFKLVNGKYVTDEKRNNSDIYSLQGEANLYHTFKDSSELDLKTYYYYSGRGLPGAVTLYNSISRERLWDENFFTQLGYKKDFSKQWMFRVHAKYNYSWNRYEDTNVKYEGGKQLDIHRQNEYYLAAVIRWNPLNSFSLALAQDGALNTLRNNINQSPDPIRYTSLTALNARFQWRGVTLLGTLVNTFITEEVQTGSAPHDRKRLSPSFSVSYCPWESQSFYIRGMYKSTFRVPTFNDLYYLRIGNVALQPEKAREYNLGITWRGQPFTFVNHLAVTLDGYYNEVTDKIVAYPSTYVWRMVNFGKVRIHGIDATLVTSIPMDKKTALMFSAAYTYQKAIDLTDPNAKNYKQQLPYTPQHSGNVAIQLTTPWIQFGYSVTGAGKRYAMAQNISDNLIKAYTEHTLTLSREFKFSTYRLRLQGEIFNLTNEQYDIIKYYPMPGRSWRLTGIFSF